MNGKRSPNNNNPRSEIKIRGDQSKEETFNSVSGYNNLTSPFSPLQIERSLNKSPDRPPKEQSPFHNHRIITQNVAMLNSLIHKMEHNTSSNEKIGAAKIANINL